MSSRCCCESQTPAEDCPDDQPEQSPTVTIDITVMPMACSPVEAITCVPANCGCDGGSGQTFIIPSAICNDACAPQFPAYIPAPVFGTGLGEAKAQWAWSTHTEEPPSNCPGAKYDRVVGCGGSEQGYEPWQISPKVELQCGTAGAASPCVPCTAANGVTTYVPTQAAYEAGNGVRAVVSGCCCVPCNCINDPKCSTVTVEIHARWKLSLSVPDIRCVAGDNGCWCNAPFYDAGAWFHRQDPYWSTQVDFIHEQTAYVVFEKTIYTNQTEQKLAPGIYAPRCATFAHQCGQLYVCGAFASIDGECVGACDGELAGGFVDAGNGCDEDCVEQGVQCDDEVLKEHGFTITVRVDS